MNTIPWYTSAIVRQQIVQMIIAGLGLFGIVSDVDWSATVQSIFAGIAALTAVWTVVTRIYKPTPAISQTAVDKEVELVKSGKIPASPTGPQTKQGGFARPLMLALLLAVSVPAALVLQACSGTQHALKEAQTPDEKAFVLLNLYDGAQHQAAQLIVNSRTPQVVVLDLQRLAPPANAAANTLRPAADAYKATKSAASEAELSKAYNDAIISINDFVAAVNKAKG